MSALVKTPTTPGTARAAVGVDAEDAGVGVRAPHEDGVQAALLAEVVDVGALATQQSRILDALPGGADVGLHHEASLSEDDGATGVP